MEKYDKKENDLMITIMGIGWMLGLLTVIVSILMMIWAPQPWLGKSLVTGIIVWIVFKSLTRAMVYHKKKHEEHNGKDFDF
jgi:hypothetical protein